MEKKLGELLNIGKSVFEREANEILAAAARFGVELADAAFAIHGAKGRLVVVGVGKSGHVGRKIAATFASLGTPSFFMHAGEALHGDLGMVCSDDVALIISNSGSSNEIAETLPYFKRIGARVVAITGDEKSPLAESADIVLNSRIEQEADMLRLAPTSSTTLQLVIGDALACMTAHLRGLKSEDFARFHPGGALGKKLLNRVCDVMYKGKRIPIVGENATVGEALFEMTKKGFGATCIVSGGGALEGIFTDGDLRRLLEKRGNAAIDSQITLAMTRSPKTIAPEKLAAEAAYIMEKDEITVLIVADQHKRPVGILQLHHLSRQ